LRPERRQKRWLAQHARVGFRQLYPVQKRGDTRRIPEIEVLFTVDASANDLSITVVGGEQLLVEQLVAILIEILRQILGR
jgi:hypothetical protein